MTHTISYQDKTPSSCRLNPSLTFPSPPHHPAPPGLSSLKLFFILFPVDAQTPASPALCGSPVSSLEPVSTCWLYSRCPVFMLPPRPLSGFETHQDRTQRGKPGSAGGSPLVRHRTLQTIGGFPSHVPATAVAGGFMLSVCPFIRHTVVNAISQEHL